MSRFRSALFLALLALLALSSPVLAAEEGRWKAFGARVMQAAPRSIQKADALTRALTPYGVAVVMEASHTCMMMRGVQKQNSTTVTSAMRGTFEEDARTRAELMGFLRN